MSCKKYNNQMNLLIDNSSAVNSVVCAVMLRLGSRYDKSHTGISHLLEHMLFRGTNTRSYDDISNAIEHKGGMFNAWCAEETLCCYVKVLSEDVDIAVEILSDIYHNSTFDSDLLVKEKNIIHNEINMDNDNPDTFLYEQFNQAIFGDDYPQFNILGTYDSISDITSSDLKSHLYNYGGYENMVFAVSGNINEDKLIPYIHKNFSNNISSNATPYKPTTPKINHGNYTFYKSDLAQALIIKYYTTTHYKSLKDAVKYRLICNILTNCSSSILYKKIREQEGLVYTIYSFTNFYSDFGSIYISSSTQPKNVDKVNNMIDDEIHQLVARGVTEEELNIAKKIHKSTTIMGLESNKVRAEWYGRNFLRYGDCLDISLINSALDSINQKDINDALQSLVSSNVSSGILMSKG